MATTILWGKQTAVSRIWAFDTLPATVPSGASKWDYFYITTQDITYIRLNNQWVVSHLQLGKGDKGDKGDPGKDGIGTNGKDGIASTIQISNISTTTLNSTNAAQVTITDNDPSSSNANWSFEFGIPRGKDGADGKDGLSGSSATISIGSTTTLNSGSNATVSNVGTPNASILNFGIPKGKDGIDGIGKDGLSGKSATIKIGTVTTLSPGSNATVSNVGTESDAILNFGIPVGETGAAGSGSGGVGSIGGVRYVTTFAELKAAWAGLTNASVRSIHLANNITQTEELVIPANYNKILEIEGHGFDWVVAAGVPNGITRSYASLTAANAGIDCQLRIRNVIFKGSPGTIGINVHATYGSKIEGCRFYNFDTGIYGGWMMGTIIDQCYFWENGISIFFDYARFTNGSNSASQSNHSIVRDCKFRHSSGQTAAIKATAVSGFQVNHNIFEGVQAGPQYHVLFDDAGSTVVKEVHIYGNHVEQQPSVAAFSVRLKDGYARVGGIYSQYDCNLIRFDSAGYAKMLVDTIPFLTNGTKFENVNGAGRWYWSNIPATFDMTGTTRWVNAAPPINQGFNNWNTNGQSPFIRLANRTL